MGDAGNLSDINGKELELGVNFTPLPFVSLRLGYLDFELDFDNDVTGRGGSTESSGLVFGVGLHW